MKLLVFIGIGVCILNTIVCEETIDDTQSLVFSSETVDNRHGEKLQEVDGLVNALVYLVLTVLAQLLNAVVTIVQCLGSLKGVNSLLNTLTAQIPGLLQVVNNAINIIGALLAKLISLKGGHGGSGSHGTHG